jgi:hydroxypyruvate isomerase
MPKFAANLSTMFTEHPFIERFGAAREAGFSAVECQFPYEAEAAEIRSRLDEHGLELVLFNTPPGDFAAGERGLAGLPGRQADFESAVARMLDYADVLGTRLLHVMAGVLPNDQRPEACFEVYRENLVKACSAARSAGRVCLIEPINTRDIPSYLLNTPDEAAALIGELGEDNLKLQFDFYHCQTMRGDLCDQFVRHEPLIPHVQIANLPGRHEPDRGEIAYDFIFDMLDRRGFTGWVGCEYVPEGETVDGLGWAVRHGIRPRDTLMATGGERV